MRIIPAVNCHHKDFACVREKVKITENFPNNGFIHLDVTDGVFAYNKTWGEPSRWKDFRSHLKLEVHLMVERPEEIFESWCDAGAKRLIVHLETINEKSVQTITDIAQKRGISRMLALNPETPAEAVGKFIKYFLEFQVLAVHPGLAAQKFLPTVLPKIKHLRTQHPSAIIEIDGGMNLETAKLAKDAGADFAVSASFIFGSPNPMVAFNAISRVAQN